MKNITKNQHGFAVGIVLVVIVIAAVIGGALYVQSNSSGEDQPDNKKTADTGSIQSEQTSSDTLSPGEADATIKNHLSQFAAAASQYAANNNGKLPESGHQLLNEARASYGEDLVHPVTNQPYTIVPEFEGENSIVYRVGARCLDDGSYEAADSSRAYILSAQLSDNSLYCIDG